jgi:hypothetical protein
VPAALTAAAAAAPVVCEQAAAAAAADCRALCWTSVRRERHAAEHTTPPSPCPAAPVPALPCRAHPRASPAARATLSSAPPTAACDARRLSTSGERRLCMARSKQRVCVCMCARGIDSQRVCRSASG